MPAEARDALKKVEGLVDEDRAKGLKVNVETKRIGLEGERRLCVTYEKPADGVKALERVRTIVKGIDLVNVVEEPCTSPPATGPKKEDLP